MTRGAKIGIGVGVACVVAGAAAGFVVWGPEEEEEPSAVTGRLLDELAAARPHAILVISGRLLAQIAGCG